MSLTQWMGVAKCKHNNPKKGETSRHNICSAINTVHVGKQGQAHHYTRRDDVSVKLGHRQITFITTFSLK